MKNFFEKFLFPPHIYKNLNENKLTLLIGILFVGLADLVFFIDKNASNLFADNPKTAVNYVIIIIAVFVIGTVDVLFFGIPVYDLLKVFKKQEGTKDVYGSRRLPVMVLKIYIMAHFTVIPIHVVTYFLTKDFTVENFPEALVYFLLFLELVLTIWFFALISRGINSIYRLDPFFKRLVFPAVLLWGTILGIVLEQGINELLIKVFYITPVA